MAWYKLSGVHSRLHQDPHLRHTEAAESPELSSSSNCYSKAWSIWRSDLSLTQSSSTSSSADHSTPPISSYFLHLVHTPLARTTQSNPRALATDPAPTGGSHLSEANQSCTGSSEPAQMSGLGMAGAWSPAPPVSPVSPSPKQTGSDSGARRWAPLTWRWCPGGEGMPQSLQLHSPHQGRSWFSPRC